MFSKLVKGTKMATLNFYRLAANNKLEAVPSGSADLERHIQRHIESNMRELFAVELIRSEYTISSGFMGDNDEDGRIDSLGIDENNAPVIFEYKRSTGENVVNQGLCYLAWLKDHREQFEKMAVGKKPLEDKPVDWDAARVICIANSFTRYDKGAVIEMNKNIALYRYCLFGDKEKYICLEKYFEQNPSGKKSQSKDGVKTDVEGAIPDLIADVDAYICSFGDDVATAQLKYYKAYRRNTNFVSLEPLKKHILLHIKLNPKDVVLEKDFLEDYTIKGHLGTGNVRMKVRNAADFEKGKHYLRLAYDKN